MNEQESQNLLLKVPPLSTVRNKLIMQGEKLEILANLRVFISPEYISLPPSKLRHTGFCSRIPPPIEHNAEHIHVFVVQNLN